jgi:hypothetical protein
MLTRSPPRWPPRPSTPRTSAGSAVWLAHCVQLDEAAVRRFAATGTSVVLGPAAPLELLLVGGVPVVEGSELRTTDPAEAAREVRAARRRLADLR